MNQASDMVMWGSDLYVAAGGIDTAYDTANGGALIQTFTNQAQGAQSLAIAAPEPGSAFLLTASLRLVGGFRRRRP